MKFTDGNWLIRPGVQAHYVRQVVELTPEASGVRLIAPCAYIRHRGDMLQGPVLTVRCDSPLPDTIRLRVTHFEGGLKKGATFDVLADGAGADVAVTEETVSVKSGRLEAIINQTDFAVDFMDGDKLVTRIPRQALALMQVKDQGNFISAQLGLGVGELVYGLGERFTAFVKNGQSIDIWNEDGGTCSEQAYKNIPFYMTNRGYGVFVNHNGRVSFEVASERSSRVQFSVPGEELEFIVIYGPSPKEVLEKYTALTGRPAVLPSWSFGLWLSTSFTTDYDQKTVEAFVDGMAQRDIPLGVFHYDCFWMKGFHWTDFLFDESVTSDAPKMLADLHAKGLKVCVWINPYIAQASRLFVVGHEHGYFLKRPDGTTWQTDLWQPGMAIVDFTNPAAVAWYCSHLNSLCDIGIDSFKTDFGERIPTDVVYHDGSDPVLMHNRYTYLYNQAVFGLLEHKRGKGEAIVFARSATIGGQQFPIHWGGDCWSDFDAMAESLRGGLSLGMCGFGYWSHDIGGFEGLPPAELYKRWVAFGLLSSHSRLHASTSYRVPWLFDEEAVDVLRYFTKLKIKLLPYLLEMAQESHAKGTPMMRAMHLEFPDDPACDTLDRQYMLGDSLLVAPVFSATGEVQYYVPKGTWTSLIDGTERTGPAWFKETHSAMSLPLLVRPGSNLVTRFP